MTQRLAMALESGLSLPDGRIAVFAPRAGTDLSPLPGAQVEVIQPFKPDHDHFADLGLATATEATGDYAAALIFLPRAKAQARALIAKACAHTSGPLIIDGQKTDGIDSIFKDLRKRGTPSDAISKAHGKLFWVTAPDVADWAAAPSRIEGGFWTAPGVFSADGIDPASRLLADLLPAKLGRYVADLGAGWGYLAARIADRDFDTLHLVEADQTALDCAARNLTDPRVLYHWADATTWKAPAPLDTIVMNPPFHTARAADPGLGRAFIASAARNLSPSGHLWMVANRHLPYESTLADRFRTVDEIGKDPRFKVFHAQKPKRG